MGRRPTWTGKSGTGNAAGLAPLRIRNQHEQIHAIASGIAELRANGKVVEAGQLHKTLTGVTNKLFDLLDDLGVETEQLAAAQ